MVKITIRVEEKLNEELRQNAKLMGLNLSEYIRKVLLGELTARKNRDGREE